MESGEGDLVRDAAALSSVLRPHLEDLEILSSARNGERLDAEVAVDGRRWWLVRLGLSAPEVFERPAVAPPPVEGGVIVVINGMSSSGKSSVVRAVVEHSSSHWVGFDEPFFGIVRPEVLVWPEQAPTLWRGFLAGISAVAAQGNRVVAAAGGVSYGEWGEAVHGSRLITVALDCSVEVLTERHRRRPDRRADLIEATTVHDGWEYDRRFDSSVLHARAIADAVVALTG